MYQKKIEQRLQKQLEKEQVQLEAMMRVVHQEEGSSSDPREGTEEERMMKDILQQARLAREEMVTADEAAHCSLLLGERNEHLRRLEYFQTRGSSIFRKYIKARFPNEDNAEF